MQIFRERLIKAVEGFFERPFTCFLLVMATFSISLNGWISTASFVAISLLSASNSRFLSQLRIDRKGLEDILGFLNQFPNLRLLPISIEDIFDSNLSQIIRIRSGLIMGEYTRKRISNKKIESIIGKIKKNFCIYVGYTSINGISNSTNCAISLFPGSFIFMASDPREGGYLDRFTILHEIAHANLWSPSYSMRVDAIERDVKKISIFIYLYIFFAAINIDQKLEFSWRLVIALTIASLSQFIANFVLGFAKSEIEAVDEIEADAFALENLSHGDRVAFVKFFDKNSLKQIKEDKYAGYIRYAWFKECLKPWVLNGAEDNAPIPSFQIDKKIILLEITLAIIVALIMPPVGIHLWATAAVIYAYESINQFRCYFKISKLRGKVDEMISARTS